MNKLFNNSELNNMPNSNQATSGCNGSYSNFSFDDVTGGISNFLQMQWDALAGIYQSQANAIQTLHNWINTTYAKIQNANDLDSDWHKMIHIVEVLEDKVKNRVPQNVKNALANLKAKLKEKAETQNRNVINFFRNSSVNQLLTSGYFQKLLIYVFNNAPEIVKLDWMQIYNKLNEVGESYPQLKPQMHALMGKLANENHIIITSGKTAAKEIKDAGVRFDGDYNFTGKPVKGKVLRGFFDGQISGTDCWDSSRQLWIPCYQWKFK